MYNIKRDFADFSEVLALRLSLRLLLFFTLAALLGVGASAAKVGEVVHTDIVAYISGYPIPSYNYKGTTMVVAESLLDYGFDVTYDNDERALRISHNPEKAITAQYFPAENTHQVGSFAMDVLSTDIVTYIEGRRVASRNVGGMTVISMDDLAACYIAPYVWDGSARTISLSLGSTDWLTEFEASVEAAVLAHQTALEVLAYTDDYTVLNAVLEKYYSNPSTWTHYAYVSRYVIIDGVMRATITIDYIADVETIAACEAKLAPIIDAANSIADEYERVRYVHDTIASLVTYDYAYVETAGSPDAFREARYHIPGVMLDGLAVCQGYTETMIYILDRCGIPCEKTGNATHAWNVVYLDGMGYHVDITWDDTGDELSYKNFMLSTEQLRRTHDYADGLNDHFTDDAMTWYRVNGLWFDSVDLARLEPIIVEAMRDGRDLELELASYELVCELHEALFKNDYIFKLLPKAERKSQTIWYLKVDGGLYYELQFSKLT